MDQFERWPNTVGRCYDFLDVGGWSWEIAMTAQRGSEQYEVTCRRGDVSFVAKQTTKLGAMMLATRVALVEPSVNS